MPEQTSAAPSPNITNWRSYSGEDIPPILNAALQCFADKGFHGTSIRQIAQAASLSVPGLYHHYPSKYALLLGLVRYAMADLAERTRQALAEAGEDVTAQLETYVECMVLFHAENQRLAFVAASEIRSIKPEDYDDYIGQRDVQHKILDDIIDRGTAAGAFSANFARETATAIVTMCTGISQWFRESGPISADTLALRFVDVARKTAGVI